MHGAAPVDGTRKRVDSAQRQEGRGFSTSYPQRSTSVESEPHRFVDAEPESHCMSLSCAWAESQLREGMSLSCAKVVAVSSSCMG